MHPPDGAPAPQPSIPSCVSSLGPAQKQRFVKEAAALLVHAGSCRDQDCPKKHCFKMKRVRSHVLECSVPNCASCKYFEMLNSIHPAQGVAINQYRVDGPPPSEQPPCAHPQPKPDRARAACNTAPAPPPPVLHTAKRRAGEGCDEVVCTGSRSRSEREQQKMRLAVDLTVSSDED